MVWAELAAILEPLSAKALRAAAADAEDREALLDELWLEMTAFLRLMEKIVR